MSVTPVSGGASALSKITFIGRDFRRVGHQLQWARSCRGTSRCFRPERGQERLTQIFPRSRRPESPFGGRRSFVSLALLVLPQNHTHLPLPRRFHMR